MKLNHRDDMKDKINIEEFVDKFTTQIAHRGGVAWGSIEDMNIVIDSVKATIIELNNETT